MTYKSSLQKALEIARAINYEPIYGGGGSGGNESKSFVNYWILNTSFWRDIGLWIDTENWID